MTSIEQVCQIRKTCFGAASNLWAADGEQNKLRPKFLIELAQQTMHEHKNVEPVLIEFKGFACLLFSTSTYNEFLQRFPRPSKMRKNDVEVS